MSSTLQHREVTTVEQGLAFAAELGNPPIELEACYSLRGWHGLANNPEQLRKLLRQGLARSCLGVVEMKPVIACA